MNKTTTHESKDVKTTPRDFFLWAGAMLSLYWSVIAYINLFFGYIDRAYPDPLNSMYIDITSYAVRFEMSSLIVLVPVCLGILYAIRKTIASDATRAEIWVRRWALYATVFVSGVSIIVTLVYTLNEFLSGSLALPFILKSLIVIGVAAIGLMHFLADIWGYWHEKPAYARNVAIGIVLMVILTVGSGFLVFGTPAQARLYRFDTQKVNDLQSLGWQIENYSHDHKRLPDQLNVLNDVNGGYRVPLDPQSNSIYEYRSFATSSYMLCANFNAESQQDLPNDDWGHDAGRYCFYRTVSNILPKTPDTEVTTPISQ